MTVDQMHKEFKMRANKMDSNTNRNFRVPEIDLLLNEAMDLAIRNFAQPRNPQNVRGFEMTQKTIDDFRTIVVNQTLAEGLSALPISDTEYLAEFPENYLYYLSGTCLSDKGSCKNVVIPLHYKQHDDLIMYSTFYNSSFEWRRVRASFFEKGIKLFSDGTFTINKVCLNYLRKPLQIHNALRSAGGQYKDLSGVVLTGQQDCELPVTIHSEIVDIAVYLAMNSSNDPSLEIKLQKLNYLT